MDSETGIVSLSENEVIEGNMTKEQASFVKELTGVLKADGVATMNVALNSESVVIGDLASNTMDVGDMIKLGTSGKVTAQQLLIHETRENYESQVNKVVDGVAHNRATNAENRAGGSITSPERFTDATNNQNFSILKIPVIGPPEQRGVVSVHLYKNNVLNVTGNSQTQLPSLKR